MPVYHLSALKNMCTHCAGSEVAVLLDAYSVYVLVPLQVSSRSTMENHMSVAPPSHAIENEKVG